MSHRVSDWVRSLGRQQQRKNVMWVRFIRLRRALLGALWRR